MAAAENTTERPAKVTTCPRLTIPQVGVVESGGGIMFSIQTLCGAVSIESWGCYQWRCEGTSEALIAAGLIEAGWIPGLPGNAKVRQSVHFDGSGPVLMSMKGKSIDGQSVLSIEKRSAKKCIVWIPTTDEQQKLLGEVIDRERLVGMAKRDEEEQSAEDNERRNFYLSMSPAELREQACLSTEMAQSSIQRLTSRSRYRYDPATTAAIHECLSRLKALIMGGRLLASGEEYSGGNVISLRR